MTSRFSALLRGARQRAGMTQEQLADRSGVGIRSIRGFETGGRTNPRALTVRRLADALEMAPEERAGLLAAAVGATTGGTVEPTGTAPVLRQLPAPPGVFVGRSRELDRLTAALDGVTAEGATVVVSAIGGGGGVGKTSLALHWAHRHLADFPDGQLFLDLRGFSPGGQPMTPAEATRSLLEALGVQPAAIPADADAQAGLYRSLVAGRRMLIVLDNVRDTGQVVPLLPGSATCTVVITSRDRLAGLVTANNARPIPLDVLDEADARDLLAARLGAHRLAEEPDATAELLACCAGLPLALAVVAARAALSPGMSLAALTAELRDVTTRLGALDADDPTASVRAAVSWTHAALDQEQAEVFAMIGLAPGPDVSLHAAAGLTGLPVEHVGRALRGLVRISLIEERAPGRFRLHDLVRLYAAERAHLDFPGEARELALRRWAEFYLHSSFAADRLLSPQRQVIELADRAEGVRWQTVAGPAAAWEWFDLEHANLMAVHHLAVERDWPELVWQLAWTLQSFRWRQAHLRENVEVWRAGVAAAESSADPAAQILAHRLLSRAYVLVGAHADAIRHLRRSLAMAEETGDVLAQANAHHALTITWPERDDRRSLDHALAAVRLHRSIGNRVGEAETLNSAGWHEAHLGEYERARSHCEAALALHRENRDRYGEALTLDSLGYIARESGRPAEALEHYQRAIALYRDNGSVYDEADTLGSLATTLHALGRTAQARATWTLALDLYRSQQRDADVQRAQAALNSLTA